MSEIVNGNPTSAETTPSAPAAAPATPNAAPAPAFGAPQAPATPGAPPEGYVPSYRVRETREAAQREFQTQWSQKEAEYQARLQAVQSQLHALVGVQPPQNPEVKAVRDQFGQLYPGLSKLEERATQLEQLLERAGDMESQTSHYWQRHGQNTMDKLFTQAADSLGAPLNDEAKRALHSSFVGYVQSSPELTERYANDPSLVQEFWKAFSSSFIDPVRRTASAGVAQRAPGALPQDTPSGAPRVPAPPQPKDLDERAANAWAQYQSTARNQS